MTSLSISKKILAAAIVATVCVSSSARAADSDFQGYFHPETHVLMVNATLTPIPGTSRVVFVKGQQLKSLAEEKKMIAKHAPMCTLQVKDGVVLQRDDGAFLPKSSSGEKRRDLTEDHHMIYFTDDDSLPVKSLKCVYLPVRTISVLDINVILGESLHFLNYQETNQLLEIMAEETRKAESSQSTRNESGRADESVVVESSSQSSAGSARN